MAGKTKIMSQIKQLLLLKKQEVSNRKAASIIGMNKETANNYVRKALADPLGIDGLLRLDDTVLEHRLKGGVPAYTDERFEVFKNLLPYFEDEMSKSRKTHVTLTTLWEEYRAEHPNGYGLTQFRFHYRQNANACKESHSTVLGDLHVGGEKLYLDFSGDRLEYIDMETGEIVKVQTFVAAFPATDYCFAICVPSQKTEDFVYACIQSFRFFEGVPKILVPDNLKAAVVRTDRYEPSVNQVFEEMANHYGAVVIPARPVHPKDKPNAEGNVKIIYNRVYAKLRHRTFYSLKELNEFVFEQVAVHNKKRMQQHNFSRIERFLAIEKPALQPLPEKDFEIRSYTDLKVSTNCCIYLGRDKHYYSVPYQYIGQQAHVVYTRTMVSVYVDGNLIASHMRDYAAGRYTTKEEHFASNSREYRSITPQKYIERAERVLPEFGVLIRLLLTSTNMPPELHYKSCDGLFHLQRSTDPILFQKVCATAINCGRYNYKFVRLLVESKCIGAYQQDPVPAPPPHSNIRGKEQFR
jgi:transposase